MVGNPEQSEHKTDSVGEILQDLPRVSCLIKRV